MLKSNIDRVLLVDYLKDMLSHITSESFYKIHGILNVTVPQKWHIEKDRRNNDLHLLFVKGGKGTYFIKNTEESLSRGKIIFVSNNCPHSSVADKNNPPTIIPIRFGVYDKRTSDIENLFNTPFYFSIEPTNTIYFERQFEQLYSYHNDYNNNDNVNFNKQACNALLTQIFIDIFNIISSNYHNLDTRMYNAKKYIEDHPTKRISLEALAKKHELSTRHFTRLFKSYYGITPKRFQLENQMQYAHFLVCETKISIKEISRVLDFPDQYSFSKQFRNIMGCSPSVLRR